MIWLSLILEHIIKTIQNTFVQREAVSEEGSKTYDNLTPAGVDPTTPVKRSLGAYLAKDPLAEQMSVDSSNSGDFTGPFFLPHMLKFGDNMGQPAETDNHTYK